VYVLAQQVGAKPVNPGLGAIERNVSEAMMGLWANFAKTGRPWARGVPDWPEYSGNMDQYLYICNQSEVRTGFSKVVEQTSP
jgi:carboxylesterase type B